MRVSAACARRLWNAYMCITSLTLILHDYHVVLAALALRPVATAATSRWTRFDNSARESILPLKYWRETTDNNWYYTLLVEARSCSGRQNYFSFVLEKKKKTIHRSCSACRALCCVITQINFVGINFRIESTAAQQRFTVKHEFFVSAITISHRMLVLSIWRRRRKKTQLEIAWRVIEKATKMGHRTKTRKKK